jgi:hypothetical protein
MWTESRRSYRTLLIAFTGLVVLAMTVHPADEPLGIETMSDYWLYEAAAEAWDEVRAVLNGEGCAAGVAVNTDPSCIPEPEDLFKAATHLAAYAARRPCGMTQPAVATFIRTALRSCETALREVYTSAGASADFDLYYSWDTTQTESSTISVDDLCTILSPSVHEFVLPMLSIGDLVVVFPSGEGAAFPALPDVDDVHGIDGAEGASLWTAGPTYQAMFSLWPESDTRLGRAHHDAGDYVLSVSGAGWLTLDQPVPIRIVGRDFSLTLSFVIADGTQCTLSVRLLGTGEEVSQLEFQLSLWDSGLMSYRVYKFPPSDRSQIGRFERVAEGYVSQRALTNVLLEGEPVAFSIQRADDRIRMFLNDSYLGDFGLEGFAVEELEIAVFGPAEIRLTSLEVEEG